MRKQIEAEQRKMNTLPKFTLEEDSSAFQMELIWVVIGRNWGLPRKPSVSGFSSWLGGGARILHLGVQLEQGCWKKKPELPLGCDVLDLAGNLPSGAVV